MTIQHARKPGMGTNSGRGNLRVQSSKYGFLSVVNFPSFARRRDRNPSLGLRTHEIGLCHFVRGAIGAMDVGEL